MIFTRRLYCVFGMVLALGLTSAVAKADFTNFANGDFAQFNYNHNPSDTATGPTTTSSPPGIKLTGLAFGETRSLFSKNLQPTTTFNASFLYQDLSAIADGSFANNPGFTFAISNDSRTFNAVGSGNGYGYTGISPSTGVFFSLGNSTGVLTNGVVSGSGNALHNVNLASGHPINVQLSYVGQTLTEVLTDMSSLQSDTIVNSFVSLPTSAYIGITANTFNGVEQLLSLIHI